MNFSMNIESWFPPRTRVKSSSSPHQECTQSKMSSWKSNITIKHKNLLWLTIGLSDKADQLSKNYREISHYWLDKECWTHFSHLAWEELALFQELSDVEKLVFLRLFLNTPILRLSYTSDAEKEETKWLKCFLISQNWQLLKKERNYQLCKEHV